MKIFLDSAKIEEIEEMVSVGIIDGVTTNPSLIKKAVDDLNSQGKNIDIEGYISEICKILGEGKPFSLEVIGTEAGLMVKEGNFLYNKFNPISGNIAIKIPISTSSGSFDGLKAVSALSSLKIPVNCTLIMSPEQALLAAKAGASYVSPFAGRIDDYLREKTQMPFRKDDYFDANQLKVDDNGVYSGVDLIRKTKIIFKNYNIKTEVISASIRNSRQAREVAEAGSDIATIPMNVIKSMAAHFKTEEGVKNFVKDIVPEYRKLFEKLHSR